MTDNKLGIIISKLRKEKGLTQKDLADELNISDKAVSRWETGSSSPNMDMLLRISKFFQVPLNDLITARVATEENGDELVEDIIHEFSELNKKNAKRIKFVFITALIIVIILTITIIFTNTYNRFKVYRVNVESKDIYSVTGVYVETNVRDILQLSDIKIRNVSIKETDTVTVDLYYLNNDKEQIIQSYSSLENISFVNYLSYFEIKNLSDYFDNLHIKVTIINSKGKQKEYIGKLGFILDFSNNKIFYNEHIEINNNININFTVDEIKDILLGNGFKEILDGVLSRKTDKYEIKYLSKQNKINYNYEENKLNYRYTYILNSNILEVLVFDKNTTKIENYQYDVTNDKVIECITGNCDNYKEALKVMNENILNLLYKKQ